MWRGHLCRPCRNSFRHLWAVGHAVGRRTSVAKSGDAAGTQVPAPHRTDCCGPARLSNNGLLSTGVARVIFATYWFLAFALIILPGYWALWRPLPRKIWLALACVVFHYHFAGPAGVLPIIILGL